MQQHSRALANGEVEDYEKPRVTTNSSHGEGELSGDGVAPLACTLDTAAVVEAREEPPRCEPSEHVVVSTTYPCPMAGCGLGTWRCNKCAYWCCLNNSCFGHAWDTDRAARYPTHIVMPDGVAATHRAQAQAARFSA